MNFLFILTKKLTFKNYYCSRHIDMEYYYDKITYMMYLLRHIVNTSYYDPNMIQTESLSLVQCVAYILLQQVHLIFYFGKVHDTLSIILPWVSSVSPIQKAIVNKKCLSLLQIRHSQTQRLDLPSNFILCRYILQLCRLAWEIVHFLWWPLSFNFTHTVSFLFPQYCEASLCYSFYLPTLLMPCHKLSY